MREDLIVITGGDPAGIGPEMLHSMVPDFRASNHRILYLFTDGPEALSRFESEARKHGLTTDTVSPDELLQLPRQADIILAPVASGSTGVNPGQPSNESGARALEALRRACEFIRAHGCRGLLTAPISKEWIARSGERGFRGHTDYLADFFERPVLMLMHGADFSVIPLTIHIPLAKVPDTLRSKLSDSELPTLLMSLQETEAYAGTRWAFCGLNPHAGEGGLLGPEEGDFIEQCIVRWKEQGLPVDGPIPADAVFQDENRAKYRLILGCYHDQVLIPFKALEGRRGVNCTIGLPFPRTSPDHGTAFDIAGQGRADPLSMREAFRLLVEGGLRT